MNNDNKSNNTSKAGGIGFLSLLALVFITLKLTGFIGWSWLWVLAPIWIPTAIVIAILLIALIVLLVKELVVQTQRQRKQAQKTADLDEEARKCGIERGVKETDQALAYRIRRMKELGRNGR